MLEHRHLGRTLAGMLLVLAALGPTQAGEGEMEPDWMGIDTVAEAVEHWPERIDTLLNALDLDRPGLAAVRTAVEAGDRTAACTALLTYYRTGDGTAWLNLIHLKDIVSALMTLLGSPRLDDAEVFNVVDDRPSRKQEIVDWLATELGMEPIPFDPTLQGRRSSRRMSPAGLPNRRVRNGRLKRMTGWAPAFRDFRAGYRDILGRS